MIAGRGLILFYGDDAVLEFFERHARTYRVQLHGIQVAIHDLPAYGRADQLLAGCMAIGGK